MADRADESRQTEKESLGNAVRGAAADDWNREEDRKDSNGGIEEAALAEEAAPAEETAEEAVEPPKKSHKKKKKKKAVPAEEAGRETAGENAEEASAEEADAGPDIYEPDICQESIGGEDQPKKRKGGNRDKTSPRKRRKIKKRYIAAAVIVALILINAVRGMLTPAQLPVVEGAYARIGDVEETLDTSGYVASETEETVFSPVTAYIASSNVEEGQMVRAGDTLITFDTETLEQAAEEASLTKQASNYGYQDTLEKANESEVDYANANTSIGILEQQIEDQENYISNIQEDMNNRQAEAQRQAAEAAAPINNRLIEINTRIEQLNSEIQNATIADPGADVSAQQAELNQLYAEKTQKEQELSSVSSVNVDVSSQQQALADAQEQLAEYQSDLAEYEAQKSAAEASKLSGSARAQISANQQLSALTASTAEDNLEKAQEGITADMNGVITNVQIVKGSPVTEGGALFTISSMDDVKVDFSVTRYNLESIQIGQKAEVTVAGNSYEGTVTKIDKIATENDSGTPVVGAEIHIDNPDENLYLGVEAQLVIHMDSAEDAVLVPVEAVNTGTSGTFCWVVSSQGLVERRLVEQGISSAEYTQILSGIASGEFVITNVTDALVEGMQVTPMDTGSEE